MKIDNINLFNFANVINGMITLNDSEIGTADYDEAKEISNRKGRSVVDTIILQHDNKVCEYCVIGHQDLMRLLSLKGTYAYKSAMNSIILTMTVQCTPEWFEDFKRVAPDTITGHYGEHYIINMTYDDIRSINTQVDYSTSPEWEYFLSRINTLPYVQQLIL